MHTDLVKGGSRSCKTHCQMNKCVWCVCVSVRVWVCVGVGVGVCVGVGVVEYRITTQSWESIGSTGPSLVADSA